MSASHSQLDKASEVGRKVVNTPTRTRTRNLLIRSQACSPHQLDFNLPTSQKVNHLHPNVKKSLHPFDDPKSPESLEMRRALVRLFGRKCTGCSVWKWGSMFASNPHKPDGLNLTCKSCRATQDVCKAVSSGRITRQPCSVCGTTVDVHAHHPDYNKPLEVTWFCRSHHTEWHGRNEAME